jgi:uridine phosphorylase
MDLKMGDLANRVITVGSASRAKIIASFFDKDRETKHFSSSRGFVTHTGSYGGVPVSVVAIGMGPSMMDFFVRESRAVVQGPMAMIRYGTCGGVSAEAKQGKIAVASAGSGLVLRNPDAFTSFYSDDDHARENNKKSAGEAYLMFDVAPADAELSSLVNRNLKEFLGEESVVNGCNVTAESFYSSQGRLDDRFHDANEGIIEKIHARYPGAITFEMESFVLFHLAKCCAEKIKAAAATIIVANRLDNCVVEDDVLVKLEEVGGHAVLKAISQATL